jgi:hypothetical protein
MNGVGTTGTTGTSNETLVNFRLVAELKLGATFGRDALINQIDDERSSFLVPVVPVVPVVPTSDS